MKLSEMRSLLRVNVDDAAADIFTDPICRDYLNAAMRYLWTEIIKQGVYLSRKTEEITFDASNAQVDLDESVQRVLSVRDSNDHPIDILMEERSRRVNYPTVFLFRRVSVDNRHWQLGWYETPTSSFTVTVTYLPKITTFIEADDGAGTKELVDIPDEYHNVVVLRATLFALGKDEQKVNYWAGLYQSEFDAMMSVLRPDNPEDEVVTDVRYEG